MATPLAIHAAITAPITLYDIPGNAPECKAWSPNTWKVRLALNYKGLPMKTEWVEYPDIEALYHCLGIPAIETNDDGSPYYCLPIIHDPSTNTTLAESFAIIQYLEKAYPSAPTLLPKGTLTFHSAFLSGWKQEVQLPTFRIACCAVWHRLNERSQIYYRVTREKSLGTVLEDVSSEDWWQTAERAWAKVDKWLLTNGEDMGELVMGNRVCFADLHIMSWILYVRNSLGAESDEWDRFKVWHGGRWERYLQRFFEYENVDI